MFLQGPGVDRSLLQLQPLLNARHLDFWLNLASCLNHNFAFTRKKNIKSHSRRAQTHRSFAECRKLLIHRSSLPQLVNRNNQLWGPIVKLGNPILAIYDNGARVEMWSRGRVRLAFHIIILLSYGCRSSLCNTCWKFSGFEANSYF